jgi:hypothetical protein
MLMAAFLVASTSTLIRPHHTAPIAEARSAQQDDVDAQEFIRAGSPASIAPLAPGEIVAIAINGSDGSPSLLAYVGNPGDQPVQLPAGEWWLYALAADGRVRQTSSLVFGPASMTGLGAGLADVPGDPAALTAALATLFHFALSSHLASLAPLEMLTEAQSAADATSDTYEGLGGLTDALGARQPDVLTAANVLSEGAIAGSVEPDSAAYLQIASVDSLRSNARAGVWQKIKGSFLGFFTSDAMTGASARKDIEALTQSYPPGRREELFQIARQRHSVDAQNADEFFERLHAGAYDSLARQFHQDFIVGSEDYAIDAADNRRRPLDTAARDGAQLVKDGAEFYADVVKTVLGARFGPDFDKGWELAQKIGDKVADIDKAVNDPAGYARDWALGELSDRVDGIEGQIKDRLQERILDSLLNAGLSDEDAQKVAGEMANRIAATSKDKLHDAAIALHDQVAAGGSAPPVRSPDDIVVPPRPSDDIVVLPADPSPTEVTVPVPTATDVPVEPTALPTATATRILAPTSTTVATGGGVEGVVRTASSGHAIAGAMVSGGGRSATTDAGGRYQLTGLTPGAVQLTASATGYISDTAPVTVPTTGNATQTFALSESLAAGQTRIVLTWGSTPRDLDSHLFTPAGAEVYYSNRGSLTSSPYAALDTDDTNGLGPETITITRLSPGTYTYSIYNFSNEAAISASGARVQVYRGDSAVQSFSVPAGTGRWWNVFTMDGTTGAITAVNHISAAGH